MNLLVQLGLCAALATVVLAAGITRTVVVSWDARRNMLRAHNDTAAKDIIAVCVLQDARMDFGWASVYVKTDSRYRDSEQAYAAGFAEGAATSSMTDEQFANVYAHYCDPDPAFCERLFAFYRANLRSMFDNAVRYSDHDPFWHQVELALLQISGMQRGLSRATTIPYEPYKLPPDIERLILLNLYKDIGDLEWAFKKRGPKAPRDLGVAFFKMGRDNSEAFASHATWGHYGTMNKLLKKYEFHYGLLPGSGHPVWSTVVTFSGYPGSISSGDDFYLTATNLAILGTGVRNQNDNLWSRLSPDNTVPSPFRSLAACRLARTAHEWLQIYSKSSSGTGNSQWTVVDYNLFKPRMKRLPTNFVWYHEELPKSHRAEKSAIFVPSDGGQEPVVLSRVLCQLDDSSWYLGKRGYSVSADITTIVEKQGYWATYNIPFFPAIFNASGMDELVTRYGAWFSYEKCPRALMFKRGYKEPNNMQQVLALIRFNNFEHDPLAVCPDCDPKYNAENALSARSDLNPPTGKYPFLEMEHRPHGGTDAKVVNSTMMSRHYIWTQCGPTWYDGEFFVWSLSPFSAVPHAGQPDAWSFLPFLQDW